MHQIKSNENDTITLTEPAANEAKRLLAKHPDTSGLRLFVKDGGCSGMSYGLGFDNPGDQDQILEYHGIKVFVDRRSAIYLKGSVLDFESGLQGKGFSLKNPNAKGSCGCGQSFSV